MEYFILFVIVILACVGFLLIRNEVVYRIRIKFLHEEYEAYDNLPSYNIMMASPTQWYLWTFKQYKRKYSVK